jgi:hypothetical protein
VDLNDLYSRHQRLIMRAALAPAGSQRARSLDMASDCARRITRFQHERGAAAAAGWARMAGVCAHHHFFPKEDRA